MQTSSPHEIALDVAAAFLKFFFDVEKRTEDNYDALNVYAADSVYKVVRPNPAESSLLEGSDAIKAYHKTLPPSLLTLDHFHAISSQNDSVLISCSGTEVIDVTTYTFHRVLLLCKTDSSYYLKSDLHNYFLPSDGANRSRRKRQEKTATPATTATEKTAPAATTSAVQEPQQQQQQQEHGESLNVADVFAHNPEPAQPVAKAPSVSSAVVVPTVVIDTPVQVQTPAPAPAPTPAEPVRATTTQPATTEPAPVIVESTAPVRRKPTSWVSAVSGKDDEPVVTPEPVAPQQDEKNANKRVNNQRKPLPACFLKQLPEGISEDAIISALTSFGKAVRVSKNEERRTAIVNFDTEAAAKSAIAQGSVTIDGTKVVIEPKHSTRRPFTQKPYNRQPKTVSASQ